MMLKKIVAETPGCDGVVLGGHGLFTWGDTQRESYLNTITIIDQLGQFIERHASTAGHKPFSGQKVKTRDDQRRLRQPSCLISGVRSLGSSGGLEVTRTRRTYWTLLTSESAEKLAHLEPSCPDHFIRTKIRPMFIK